MHVIGNEHETLEQAAGPGGYRDEGAVCEDTVHDGVIPTTLAKVEGPGKQNCNVQMLYRALTRHKTALLPNPQSNPRMCAAAAGAASCAATRGCYWGPAIMNINEAPGHYQLTYECTTSKGGTASKSRTVLVKPVKPTSKPCAENYCNSASGQGTLNPGSNHVAGCTCTCTGRSTDNPAESTRSYSSIYDPVHKFSMIDSPQAWSSSKNSVGEWLQLDLGSDKAVSGIVVQKRIQKFANQYVKSVTVQVKKSGVDCWTDVDGGNTLDASQDDDALDYKREIYFANTYTARYVRISPMSYNNHMSMRAGALLGSNRGATCIAQTAADQCAPAGGPEIKTYEKVKDRETCAGPSAERYHFWQNEDGMEDDLIDGKIGAITYMAVDVMTTGYYVVTYKARNKAGLYNDSPSCIGKGIEYLRTVVVRDTLKPVITLKYRSQVVAQGQGHEHSQHGPRNPAYDLVPQWHPKDSAAYTVPSRACIVGSSAAACPSPTCEAHDAHDSSVQCEDAIIQTLRSFPANARSESSVVQWGLAKLDRNTLGESMLTYRAMDTAQNEADRLKFKFEFVDPLTPEIHIMAPEGRVGYSNEMKGWANKLKSSCAMREYTEACLDIADTDTGNSWGYAFSSKKNKSEISGAVVGANWWSGSFGSPGFVAPRQKAGWAALSPTNHVYPSVNLESGFCNQRFGESAAHNCSRAGKDTAIWVFDGNAFASDNYRDKSRMRVYMKVNDGAWTPARPHTFCMLGEPSFVVHWYVDDGAQDFGYKADSNPQVHRVQLDVSDNTRPRIMPTKYGAKTGFADIVSGSSGTVETTETQYLECGTAVDGSLVDPYVEAGAEIDDNSDGKTCTGRVSPILRCEQTGVAPRCKITGNVDVMTPGTSYSIKYDYTDAAGNQAFQVTRPVTVADTTPPELDLLESSAGPQDVSAGFFDVDRVASMFEHRDNCVRDITTTVTLHRGGCSSAADSMPLGGGFLAKFTWNGVEGERGTRQAGTQQFPELEPGTFAVLYTTTDGAHTATACRTVRNVD
eukprot:g6410.t1